MNEITLNVNETYLSKRICSTNFSNPDQLLTVLVIMVVVVC